MLVLAVSIIPTFADTSGNYLYTDNGSTITITGVVTNPTGELTIPSTIIGKTVTNIGSAFVYSFGLTKVTIPFGVITIGNYAFQYCSALTTVSIPATVTSIGVDAFGSCSSLIDIALPSNVTSIGDRAFENCNNLPDVTIPASVTSIGSDAFRGCTGLSSLTVESTNPSYSSANGVLFNKAQNTLIQYPAQSASETYTIPSTVTSIGANAFGNCASLTSVTIPNSVTIIGTYAFEGCGGLTGMTIPSGVASIGNSAFSDCPNIASFMVDATNSNYSSADGALFDKQQTTLIQYPVAGTGSNYVIPSSVTTIGDGAFQNCYKLTGVTIPSGVTSIGSSAFSFCGNLASVTFPTTLTSIGSNAFDNCGGLTSVTIPSSVLSIGNLAFYHCSKLTSATFLGNAPTTMGFYVFNDAASGFTIYYSSGSTGFTSPTWMGYPAAVGGGSSPRSSWLSSNGLSPTADLLSTPNYDGVSLLMDYALELDPKTNESANLPKSVFTGSRLQISFPCDVTRTDISYSIQASSSLTSGDWIDIAVSSGGAIVQPVGTLSTVTDSGTGVRTATVAASAADFPQGHGFLRIKVSTL